MYKLALTEDQLERAIFRASSVSLDFEKHEFVIRFTDVEILVILESDLESLHGCLGEGEIKVHSWESHEVFGNYVNHKPEGCFALIKSTARNADDFTSLDYSALIPHPVLGASIGYSENNTFIEFCLETKDQTGEYNVEFTFFEAIMEIWLKTKLVKSNA